MEIAPLRRRVLGAATVVVIGEGASRFLVLISVLILGSLLSPEDFGLAAMAALVMVAVQTALAVGIPAAVCVLSREREFARAALCIAVLTGIAGCGFLLLTADLWASLLGNHDAAPLIRALAPVIILDKWAEVQAALLERDLSFRWTTSSSVAGAAAGLSAAVLAAKAGMGPWSLVLQSVVARGILVVALTLPNSAVRVPLWAPIYFRELWSYCRNVLGSGVIGFAYGNIDDVIVSRLKGAVALGHYRFSYLLSNTPAYATAHVINRVMLPTYTNLLGRNRPVGGAYSGLILTVAWAGATVAGGVAFLGPDALRLVYGDKWNPALSVLRILAVYGFVRALGATSGTLFLALGRPDLSRRIAQWQLLAMVPALCFLTATFGISGAAVAVTLPLTAATAYAVVKGLRLVGAPVRPVAMRVVAVTIIEALSAAGAAEAGHALGRGGYGVVIGAAVFTVGSLIVGATTCPPAARYVTPRLKQLFHLNSATS